MKSLPTLKENILELRKKIIEKDFSRMNNMQKKAVFHTEGPLLILAGAGSGKTTVLINRIGNLVKYGDAYESDSLPSDVNAGDIILLERVLAGENVADPRLFSLLAVNPPRPYEILAITFTNKAAGELKERLEGLLGEDSKDIWAFTFHSACLRMLRRFSDRIGFSSHFTIYDTDDSKRVVKECQKQLGLDDKLLPFKSIMSHISRAKDMLITPEEYEKENAGDYRLSNISKVYKLYQQKLKKADAMDFDDIIVWTVRMFEQNPDVLSYYQNKFKYIMVDEYQDTNHAQYMLVKLLASAHRNICVVGDDNQSIYRFRGATIENILSFEKQYKDAFTVRLEQNYRSTGNILDAANAVIKHNVNQKEKNLWTDIGSGDKIEVFTAEDEYGEARFVADKILDSVNGGDKFSENAVLYRMNAMSGNIESAFVRSGIPYRIIGGTKFYDRKEIKDALAYLHLAANPDDDLRFRRIINEPKRGIGQTSLTKLAEIAATLGISMFRAAERADEFEGLTRAADRLMDFTKLMKPFIESSDEALPSDILTGVLENSGYLDALRAAGEEEVERLENVNELKTAVLRYEQETEQPSLTDYLDGVALITDLDNYNSDTDAVVLMTIHTAKGLEFKNVFVVGMEENIFPGTQSIYGGESEIEEERRLAYVAITRAKKRLYLTNSFTRMLFGSTNRNVASRFLNEIPDSLTNRTEASPAFGRFFGGSAGSGGTFGFYGDSSRSADGGSSGKSFGRNAGGNGGGGFGAGNGGRADRSGTRDYSASGKIGGSNRGSSLSSSSRQNSEGSKGFGYKFKSAPSGRTDFSAGDCVKHKAFGKGMVIEATPMGDDVLLTIAFDKVGTKKLMAKFAKLDKE